LADEDRAFTTFIAQANTAATYNRDSEALRLLDAALAIRPGDRDAANMKGGLLGKLGRFDDALAVFMQGIAANPEAGELHYNAAFALQCLERYEQAAEEYGLALKYRPNFPEALSNLGLTLNALWRREEALNAFDEALKQRPNFARALNNRGITLAELRRTDEAIASYNAAIALDPAYREAFNNRGSAYGDVGRLSDALNDYARATAIDPRYADAYVNEAFVRLVLGDFERGWQRYEWRREGQFGVAPRPTERPEWHGENITGRTLLLIGEQGLGDTIQFCRYATHLAANGVKVVLEVQPALQPLLSTLRGVYSVIEIGAERPPFDLHRALLSMPFVLKTQPTSIPAQVPYLFARPERTAAWRERLADAGKGLKVGIAWQGSRGTKLDVGRSIPLSMFAPLAAVPGVRLISLQKGTGVEQLEDAPPGLNVQVLGDDFDSEGNGAFLDTAAVMQGLDLVITSDTAVAHVAGALGRPVWVALKTVPDWRWMLSREDSPWYPTMRLFRQRDVDDWQEVFVRIAQALASLAGNSHGKA
jgi:tetratricopeptide (TPR) repeat protein